MKYAGIDFSLSKLSTIKNRALGARLKAFLSSHFKFAIFTPKKAINYSERLLFGEKFILDNPQLYPYNYPIMQSEVLYQPANYALFITNQIKELEIQNKVEKDPKSDLASISLETNKLHIDYVLTNIEEGLKFFNGILQKNSVNTSINYLDLPLVFYSRVIYFKNSKNIYSKGEEFINEVSYKRACEGFIKKLEFADADSIAYVITSVIDNNAINSFSNDEWTQIFKRLDETHFEKEYTKVNNCSPHLFRYKEVSRFKFDRPTVLEFDLAQQTLNSLEKASEDNVLPNIRQVYTKFADRFDTIKK